MATRNVAASVTRCVKSFWECLKDLGVTPETKVGIALTGGMDSSALLWLAKRALKDKNVIALTATQGHSDNEARCRIAGSACKVASRLKVEHHMVEKKSPAHVSPLADLTSRCKELGVKVLLCGHNKDEQIECLFQGFTKENSVLEDFMRYWPVSYHYSNQTVAVLRPLLSISQDDLNVLFHAKGLNCNSGKSGCGTSSEDGPQYSYLQHLLLKNPGISRAAHELQEDIERCGQEIHRKVCTVILKNQPDKFCGYVSLNSALQSLPWPVLSRVFARLHLLLMSEYPETTPESILALRKDLSPSNHQQEFEYFQLKIARMKNNGELVCVANPKQPCREEIKIGEQLWWCKRWLISLKNFHQHQISEHVTYKMRTAAQRKYFVRKLDSDIDYERVKLGIPMALARHVLNMAVMDSYPLIEDHEGEIVAVPHLKYLDRTFNVHVTIDLKLPPLNPVLMTETRSDYFYS